MRPRLELLLICFAASLATTGCAPATREPPNIVLIVADAMRADHLGVYGYERDTSEHIDLLASEGVVFEQAIAQAASTTPSMTALVTSRFVWTDRNDVGVGVSRHRTLVAALRDRGYQTAGFVSNPWMRSNGFDAGYDDFEYIEERDGKLLVERARGILESDHDEPLFLYLHFMDVHSPYAAPEKFQRRFRTADEGRFRYANGQPKGPTSEADVRHGINLYDAEIAYFDSLLGELFEILKDTGDPQNTLLALVADHGDEFAEHGLLGHGYSVYDSLIRVPLIIHYPARLPKGERISSQVRLLDLAPTLLDLARLEPDPAFRGESLVDWIEGERDEDLPALSVTAKAMKGKDDGVVAQHAVRTGTLKYIRRSSKRETTEAIYDIEKDPGEERNLLHPGQPGLADHLRGVYQELAREAQLRGVVGKGSRQRAPDDLIPQLKALGYLDVDETN